MNHFDWFSFDRFGVAFFLIAGFVIPPFGVVSRMYPIYWVALIVSLMALHFVSQKELVDWRHPVLFFTHFRDLAWLPSLDGISWTLEIEIKFYNVYVMFAGLFCKLRLLLFWLMLIVVSYVQSPSLRVL